MVDSQEASSSESEKQYFINEDKFQLLKQCQQTIYETTEVSPTLRKLVNAIITVENLDKVKAKIIEALS